LRVLNSTHKTVLVERLEVADTFLSRMTGLLGRPGLAEGDGLLITGCNSIHMFFMRFAIDVVFLNEAGRVIGLVERIPPFALSPVFWKAAKALELPAGTIERSRTQTGDQLDVLL